MTNDYYKIGATSFYYKLGQALLQIGASFIITNQGSYYKLGQPLLPTGANFITN